MPNPPRLRLCDFVSASQHYHFACVEVSRRTYAHLHQHDFYEVLWIQAGEGVHSVNGSESPLVPGSVFLICPDDFHDFRVPPRKVLRLANVAFSRATLSALSQRYPRVKKLFTRPQAKREIATGALSAPFLAEAVADLSAGCGERLEIDRFLLNLAAELRRARQRSPLMPDWLGKACRGVTRPEIFTAGPRAFYDLAGRSPEHVIRETRRWIGLSPTELINRERLRFAAQQLSTTNRPIIDIAAECGVENLSHFYKLFRAAHGCPPRQFRLRSQAIVLGWR